MLQLHQEQRVSSTSLPLTQSDPPPSCILNPHLPVSLAVLALLADPVDGVEVIVGAHPRNGLLQEVQQVGGAAGSPTPVRHGVVRPWRDEKERKGVKISFTR